MLSPEKNIQKMTPGLKKEIIKIVDERIREAHVTKEDFSELKNIVKDFGKSQKEIAEAQKRTGLTVEELAEAQKRTELAVKQTQDELRGLVEEHRETRRQLGGLSMTVGYSIEDRLMPFIFDFGKKTFGIEIEIVDRRNIIHPDGAFDEINIYAEGRKNGQRAFLIGECKSQPGKRDIDRFDEIINRIRKLLKGDLLAFIVGCHYHPDVEQYIKNQYPGIRVFKTFEIERFRKKDYYE